MADEFDFAGHSPTAATAQHSGGAAAAIGRVLAKLRGTSKATHLKTLAGLLEGLPQDAASLGPGSERDALLERLAEHAILHAKQRDVRMYAAACFAQLLRIYAPERPYEEKVLEVRVWAGAGGLCAWRWGAGGAHNRSCTFWGWSWRAL